MLVGLLKFIPAPALAVWQLLAAIKLPGAGNIAALIAISVILGGVFMFGRLKTRADEAERLMQLAREEASIQRERAARIESENVTLRAEPNLKQHARLLEKLLNKADEQTNLLREIRASVTVRERG